MDNSPVIVLVDPNTIVRNRVKSVLASQNVTIFEATDRQAMLAILSETYHKIDLVITEIEIDTSNVIDGVSLIQLVKQKRSSIPVVVLTSVSKKDIISRCLLEGASDYILKPFEDELLKEKLLKYINIESLTELTVLKFNLKNYLENEIYKAKKGKYHFSLLKVHFDSREGNDLASGKYEFYNHAESIYKEMKLLFWESDIYIQHGFQSHLGFFPFCDQQNTKVIIKKIESAFTKYKSNEPGICNYIMTHAFVTYPTDGETASDLLSNLALITRDMG